MRWYLLRDGFLSYRAWIDRPRSLPESYRLLPEDRDRTTAFDREIPASFFAFNALRSFDLPQLLAVSQAEGLIVNPLDGDRERLLENVARGLLPRRVRVVSADEPGRRSGSSSEAFLARCEGARMYPTPQDERRDASDRGGRKTADPPDGLAGKLRISVVVRHERHGAVSKSGSPRSEIP